MTPHDWQNIQFALAAAGVAALLYLWHERVRALRWLAKHAAAWAEAVEHRRWAVSTFDERVAEQEAREAKRPQHRGGPVELATDYRRREEASNE